MLRPYPEPAYVIGAGLGDGCARYEGDHHHAAALGVKDYDFGGELGRCAAMILGGGAR